MTSKKGKPNAFGDLLTRRIAEAGLNDSAVADAVGVSKGTISQLRAGKLAASQKLVPAVAWALNRAPSNLFDEICILLQSAGHTPGRCLPVDQVVSAAKQMKEMTWIAVPRYVAEEVSLAEEIRKLVSSLTTPSVVFTTPDRAKAFRDEPWPQRPGLSIKTPSETLLNLEYPLLFVDPNDVHDCQLFRLMFTPAGLFAVRIGASRWSSFLQSNLSFENHLVNIAELAAIEQEQSAGIVILYTHDFPEDDETLLLEAVKNNIKKGKRYLYLFPALGTVEMTKARLTYNKLKTKLRNSDVDITDRNFSLLDVDPAKHGLFREGTFILYAEATFENDPDPRSLYKQVEGTRPIRFQEADSTSTAQFFTTLIQPLQQQIRNWIGGEAK